MTRILTCLAAASLFAAVGCANQKKIAEPNPLVDNTPAAAAPVPYQPAPAPMPVQQTAAVTSTPAESAATPASASMPDASITGKKYTIKAGDNLYKIAKAKYGNGNDYKKILAANPGLNENRLIPGKTIVLP